MITTRRSDGNSISAFNSDSSRVGVALLERKEPVTYKEYVAPETTDENVEQARARMQENLARLMNYDRYAEEVQDVAQTATVERVEIATPEQASVAYEEQVEACSDDDIRPTSTTMQFGDGDIESLRMDMQQKETSKGKYHLNGKGKLVVVLYALVLTVVMALIAINTGVLASLSSKEQILAGQANVRIQELNALNAQIESISTPEYIAEKALELDMIKG